jgi:hypothetical protein
MSFGPSAAYTSTAATDSDVRDVVGTGAFVTGAGLDVGPVSDGAAWRELLPQPARIAPATTTSAIERRVRGDRIGVMV